MLYDLLPEIYKDEGGKKLSDILDRPLTQIESVIEQLWDLIDVDKCPARFLPYLAKLLGWELVGDDEQNWRRQIRYAIQLNKTKGRYDALVFLFKMFGYDLEYVKREWTDLANNTKIYEDWDVILPLPSDNTCSGGYCPGSNIEIGVRAGVGVSPDFWSTFDGVLTRAIPIDVKPTVKVIVPVASEVPRIGMVSLTGELTTIYPYSITELSQSSQVPSMAVGMHSGEITTIYPGGN